MNDVRMNSYEGNNRGIHQLLGNQKLWYGTNAQDITQYVR